MAGEEDTTTQPQGADSEPKGDAPGPVPYEVFSRTNAERRALERQVEQLQSERSKLLTPEQVEEKLSGVRADFESRLLLGKAGVPDQYQEYMLGRMRSAAPEDPGAWLTELKAQEPAFFSPTKPAADTTTPNPQSNPDRAAAPGPTSQRPINGADVKGMTREQYQAWREAQGVKGYGRGF